MQVSRPLVIPLAGVLGVLGRVYFYLTVKAPGAKVQDAILVVSRQTACLSLGFVTSTSWAGACKTRPSLLRSGSHPQ